MTRHWFRQGFWQREERVLVTLAGGRRPPWRLTGRELAVHAVFFVLNLLLFSLAVDLVLAPAWLWPGPITATLAFVGFWALVIAALRGKLPKLTIRRR